MKPQPNVKPVTTAPRVVSTRPPTAEERRRAQRVLLRIRVVVHITGKTNTLEGRPIAQVFGFEVVGLLEKIVGRHELLPSLRILTLGKQIFGFVGDGGERYNRDQQQQ